LVPDALKTLRDSDRAMVELNNARTSGKLSQAALSQLEMNYIRALAPSLVDSKFNPIVVDAILEKAKMDGFDVEPWRQLATTDPQQFHDAVVAMVTPKKDLMNIPDGGVVFDPNTRKPVYENEKPAPVLSIDDQLAAAYKAGDLDEVNRIVKLKKLVADATRAPEKSEGGISPNESISATMRLRQQYSGETKAAREAQLQFAQMKSALKAFNSGSEPGGSQGVLVTFQKILDPISVVRESEYSRSASGLSILAQLQGKYEQLVKGGAGVPASELQGFVDLAEQFAKNQVRYAEVTRGSIESIINDYGLNPKSILIDLVPPSGGGGKEDPMGIRR
jgi:hypothetical protein